MPALKFYANPDTRSLTGVQIFATGKWNGSEFSTEDLDLMVEAWSENSKAIVPYLKLGHDDEQKLLQNDGLPAAGWVDRIYRYEDKLYADISDIPQKIFDLITRKAYRKVSVEIYLDVEIRDKKYKYLIGAVALLGADTPGVMVLDDILSQYGLDSKSTVKVFSEIKKSQIVNYSTEFDITEDIVMPKTEAEIKLELDLAAMKAEREKFETDLKKLKGENDESLKALEAAKKAQEEAEKVLKEANEKLFKADVDGKISQLLSEKLITPSMKPFVEALIGTEKKEYTFGEDKKMSKFEVVKEICKLFAATSKVNTDENTEDVEGKRFSKDNEEIEKYMKEKNCTYRQAYDAIVGKKA